MVREAEENADADKEAREQVEAKNQLEAYLYSLRSSAEDSLKDKLDEADRELLITTAKDGLDWLDENANRDKDEIEEKRKEIEAVANPIISKAYGSGAPPEDEGEARLPLDLMWKKFPHVHTYYICMQTEHNYTTSSVRLLRFVSVYSFPNFLKVDEVLYEVISVCNLTWPCLLIPAVDESRRSPQLVSKLLVNRRSIYISTVAAGSLLLTQTKKALGFKSQANLASLSIVTVSKQVEFANTISIRPINVATVTTHKLHHCLLFL